MQENMTAWPVVAVTLLLAACLTTVSCTHGKARPPCSESGQIGTICGFESPEDLEYVRTARLVVVSNMRMDAHDARGGFIAGLVPGTHTIVRLWPGRAGSPAEPDATLGEETCTSPPDAGSFYPHGITSARHGDQILLYVIGHTGELGGREAIEVFALSGSGSAATLTWKACIPTDGKVQANDLAVTRNETIVASNYQPDGSLINMLSSSLLGTDTGDIMRWQHGEGWHHIEGTEAAMANGVALSADDRMLFYTETITGLLHRRPLDSAAGAVSVEIGGNPDNLTWTRRGTLLVATHTAGAKFLLCALGREPCKTSWEVDEVDPDTMAVRRILVHDGESIGAVATALEVGPFLYLGSVFDDRIGAVPLNDLIAGVR